MADEGSGIDYEANERYGSMPQPQLTGSKSWYGKGLGASDV